MQQLFGFAQQAGLNLVRIWAFAPGTGLQTAPGELFNGDCCIFASLPLCVWACAPGTGLQTDSGDLCDGVQLQVC